HSGGAAPRHLGDLPLPWQGDERVYNPDFVVVDTDGALWVIETKADDTAEDADVRAKREAAMQWAAHVSALTGEPWSYLFVTESDIATVRESGSALKQRALARWGLTRRESSLRGCRMLLSVRAANEPAPLQRR